jgi:putative aldouronate transport system substrate-binding protein
MVISYASIFIKEGVDYNEDKMAKHFLDKFNLKLEVVPVQTTEWREKMNIWISSHDMPDVCVIDYVHGDAVGFVEQELLYRFPDDWKTRWPHVASAYKDTVVGEQLGKLFGGTYFIPKPIFSANKPCDPLADHTCLSMRLDWLKAVGAPIKDAYKVSEIMDIARLIKEKDPGKLGNKLFPISARAVRLSSLFVVSQNARASSTQPFYKGKDGRYRWGPADESTLEGLKLFKQAYQEGLINPEFFTLKGTEDRDLFHVTGQVAIIPQNGQAMDFHLFERDLQQLLNTDEDLLHTAIPLGEDGRYHKMEATNFWSCAVFSPQLSDEKFERIMDLFDYVTSPEGQQVVRYGFENEDYTVNSDGSYNILLDENTTIMDKYPACYPIFAAMVILEDDFMMVDPAYPKKYRDMSWHMYNVKAGYFDDKTPTRIDWDIYFYDSPSYRKTSFDLETEYAELILMDGDLETNWRNWIAEKAPLIDPVLEELNANLD